MKLSACVVLALLAVSVVTLEAQAFQDWQSFDEAAFSHVEEDEDSGMWRNTTENKMEMKDGQLVKTSYIRRTWVDTSRKIQKIKRIIHTPVAIDNVYEVVRAFSEEYGKPLTDLEFELFNTIAITEGNHFHMKYLVRQVKREDLSKTLRKIIKIFSVPMTEDDIAGWEHEIDKKCSQKYKVLPLDTRSVEVHRKNKWLVRTEVLMATCGQEKNAGFQLFAWAAYKDGAYKPLQYSVENSETIDNLITRWLYANMNAMLDCERDDVDHCDNEESSLSEFSISESIHHHVKDGDKWREHAVESSNPMVPPPRTEPSIKPNPDLSDKPVWNGEQEKGSKMPSP